MSLSAEALKYVVDMSESRMPLANACPAAKGNVCERGTRVNPCVGGCPPLSPTTAIADFAIYY